MESMKGKLDGSALRVPIPTGSLTDFTATLKKSATVEKTSYGAGLKMLDRFASGMESLGSKVARLDKPSLMRSAKSMTGLDDWGGAQFLPYLEELLLQVQEQDPTTLARVVIRQAFLQALATRLRLAKHLDDHPEIRDVAIERPLFIVGFPRTGRLRPAQPNCRLVRPGDIEVLVGDQHRAHP